MGENPSDSESDDAGSEDSWSSLLGPGWRFSNSSSATSASSDFFLDAELDSMPELASIGHSSGSEDESSGESDEGSGWDDGSERDSGANGDGKAEFEESMEADPSHLARYVRNSI